ncbi:hypothetical protein, partial [Anaerococcus octavius]|uniref:hypothetical protein n=2 Tax=Peptoniphilaceae TaxID=1570339 RepID=UPI0027B98C20
MKINNLNKTLLAAFMAVTLASCSNSSAPQSDAAANESADTEVVAENSDIIDESIKEDSENNKPADNEVVEDKESTKNSDNKEISSDKKSTIDVEKKEDSSTENKEENNDKKDTAAEDKEENNSQDNINYQEKDGSYISNLVSSKNGDRDPQMGLSSLSNLNIENNSLILEGSIDYLQNPDSYDNSEDYDKATYNFKINSDT